MAFIYRIETSNGDGIYETDGHWLYDEVAKDGRGHNYLDGRPVPEKDGIEDLDRDEYCGFSSIEQLKNWFDCKKALIHLQENGYRLAVYICGDDDCRYGYAQMVFKRRFASLHNVLNMENI